MYFESTSGYEKIDVLYIIANLNYIFYLSMSRLICDLVSSLIIIVLQKQLVKDLMLHQICYQKLCEDILNTNYLDVFMCYYEYFELLEENNLTEPLSWCMGILSKIPTCMFVANIIEILEMCTFVSVVTRVFI